MPANFSMKNTLTGNPEIVFALGGAVSSFIMAFLRSIKMTRKRFVLRMVEAFMCSMLSSAISIGIVQYFHVSYIWSIPIGTLVGFIGTDVIHSAIVGWIAYNELKLKKATNDTIEKLKNDE